MSRKLFAFLLSEMSTVRVICKQTGCGVVTELPVTKMAGQFTTPTCSACRQSLVPQVDFKKNALVLLAEAIVEMQRPEMKADIEFILTDPSAD